MSQQIASSFIHVIRDVVLVTGTALSTSASGLQGFLYNQYLANAYWITSTIRGNGGGGNELRLDVNGVNIARAAIVYP